jgi:hypothetical protein
MNDHHTEHLICGIKELTRQVERVAEIWADDLEWRKRRETVITPADHLTLNALILRGQRIARKLKPIAAALKQLDDLTTASQ